MAESKKAPRQRADGVPCESHNYDGPAHWRRSMAVISRIVQERGLIPDGHVPIVFALVAEHVSQSVATQLMNDGTVDICTFTSPADVEDFLSMSAETVAELITYTALVVAHARPMSITRMNAFLYHARLAISNMRFNANAPQYIPLLDGARRPGGLGEAICSYVLGQTAHADKEPAKELYTRVGMVFACGGTSGVLTDAWLESQAEQLSRYARGAAPELWDTDCAICGANVHMGYVMEHLRAKDQLFATRLWRTFAAFMQAHRDVRDAINDRFARRALCTIACYGPDHNKEEDQIRTELGKKAKSKR